MLFQLIIPFPGECTSINPRITCIDSRQWNLTPGAHQSNVAEAFNERESGYKLDDLGI